MICRDGEDLVLHCYLQPRASRDEICGDHDGALRIRLRAAPVDGQANQALVRFLAREFGVHQRQVILESGASSRHKRLRIQCPRRLPETLAPLVAVDQ